MMLELLRGIYWSHRSCDQIYRYSASVCVQIQTRHF